MSLNVSGYDISDIYVGNNKIDSIFVGEDLVYSSAESVVPFYFEVIDPTETATVGFKRQVFSNSGVSYTKLNSYSGSVTDIYANMTLEYSYDRSTWAVYTLGTNISLGGNNPSRVYFQKEMGQWENDGFDSSQGKFGNQVYWTLNAVCSGADIAVGGNPNTMHSPNNASIDFPCAFHSLFFGCTNIVDASELDLNIALEYDGSYFAPNQAYAYMFAKCTALVTPPQEIPIIAAISNETVQNTYTCGYMFLNCSSLATAPELPSTDMCSYAYYYMFYGCTSLTMPPELPATTLSSYCYSYMFSGCTALEEVPELPATTLATSCYRDMFQSCSSLTTPTELPATTMTNGCYAYMFTGCTSMNSLPLLPGLLLNQDCYSYMFNGINFPDTVQVSTTQTSTCPYAYRIPPTGTAEDTPNTTSGILMIFGNVSETILPNTTYYLNIPTIS